MSKFLISPLLIFSLFFIILGLHILAMIFGWYWSIPNFDNVHHFLGGFWSIAIFFHFLKNRPGLFDPLGNFWATLIFGLGFAALAGTAWEFFEFSIDQIFVIGEISPVAQLGLRDTMGDLFFDFLGGLVFVVAFFSSSRRND